MEGVVNVEWHGQDYLYLKWHVVCSGLATPVLVDNCSRAEIDYVHGYFLHCDIFRLHVFIATCLENQLKKSLNITVPVAH